MHVVAEPGPGDLACDQRQEPHHGQAPEHQRAGGKDMVQPSQLPKRGCGLGDVADGEGRESQCAASEPMVAAPRDEFAEVEAGGSEDVEGEPENQRGGRGADKPDGAVADRQEAPSTAIPSVASVRQRRSRPSGSSSAAAPER